MESKNGTAEAMVDKRAMFSAPVVAGGNLARGPRPARAGVRLIHEEEGSGARLAREAVGPAPHFTEIGDPGPQEEIAGLNARRRWRELGPQDFA